MSVSGITGLRNSRTLLQISRLLFRSVSFTHSIMEERPIQMSIEMKLLDTIKPSHLEVFNESHMHNVPRGSETHFKVVIVAESFQGVPLIKRHRLVMDTLKAELEGGVHALSIQAKTPEQWEASGGKVAQSPPCLGGAKR